MCEPLILSIGGKGPSECGTISPESANPFKAAKTFDPLVRPLRPISRTASLTPLSPARRPAAKVLPLPHQVMRLYILVDVRPAPKHAALGQGEQSLVAARS